MADCEDSTPKDGENTRGHGFSLKQTILDFLESTTGHGLGRISTSQSVHARIFWFTTFIVACLLYGILAIKLAIYFRSDPLATKVRIADDGSLPFPSVTICNINKLRQSKVAQSRFQALRPGEDLHKVNCPQPQPGAFRQEERRRGKRASTFGGTREGGTASGTRAQLSPLTGFQTGLTTGKTGSMIVVFAAEGNTLPTTQASLDTITTPSAGHDVDDGQGEVWNSGGENGAPTMATAKLTGGENTGEKEVNFEDILCESKTTDFGDIQDSLQPTPSEAARLGHQSEKLVSQCSFSGESCDHKDFRRSFEPAFGNCYTFNQANDTSAGYAATRRMSRAGLGSSMRITLNVEPQEYISLFSEAVGAVISVQHPSEEPHPEKFGAFLQPGRSTFIGLKQRLIKRIRGCREGTTRSQRVGGARPQYRYTRASCVDGCASRLVAERCGCRHYDTSSSEFSQQNPTLASCDYQNTAQKACAEKATQSVMRGDTACDCLPPCEKHEYQVTRSSTDWPSNAYEPFLHLGLRIAGTDDVSLGGLAKVVIYYESLSLEIIEEFSSYGWENFVSELGGSLGLCVGFSLVTVMEFVAFAFALLKNFTVDNVGHTNIMKRSASTASSSQVSPLYTLDTLETRDQVPDQLAPQIREVNLYHS